MAFTVQYTSNNIMYTSTYDTITEWINFAKNSSKVRTATKIKVTGTAPDSLDRLCAYAYRALTTADLSELDISNVTDMKSMFHSCAHLKKIIVGDNWDTSNVTSSDDMFNGCTSLPNFDSTNIDKTKAYVGAGGYLSAPEYFVQLKHNDKNAYPKVLVDGTTIVDNNGILSAVGGGESADLTNYYTKSEVDTELAGKEDAKVIDFTMTRSGTNISFDVEPVMDKKGYCMSVNKLASYYSYINPNGYNSIDLTIDNGNTIIWETYAKENGVWVYKPGRAREFKMLTTTEIASLTPTVATTSTTGIVKPDGTSITITSDGTISAVTTPIVILTQAEYDALTTKDPNTLYFIKEE